MTEQSTGAALRRFVECGCCGGLHRADYWGECRNGEEYFTAEEDVVERLGLERFEVERFDFDRHGNMTEHWVETWPDGMFVEGLPLF